MGSIHSNFICTIYNEYYQSVGKTQVRGFPVIKVNIHKGLVKDWQFSMFHSGVEQSNKGNIKNLGTAFLRKLTMN